MRNKGSMPQARQEWPSQQLQWDLSPLALARWTPDLMAATATGDNTISILDPIGMDPWTGEGVTAKRIAAALRSIGPKNDVVVLINTPGGSWVEGNAIYNLLLNHEGHVQGKILGMAASAGSLIAMGCEELLIARSAFVMMHNMFVGVIGNRLDLRDVADQLEPFDASMADIYAARSGMDTKVVQKMMDKETFINGGAAVEQGFADALLPADEVQKDPNAKGDRFAAQLLDTALAKAGMPRSERRALLQEFKSGTPSAAGAGTPGATEDGTRNAAGKKSSGEQLLTEELRAYGRQLGITT